MSRRAGIEGEVAAPASRGPSIRARVTIAATAAVAMVLLVGGVLTVATFADRERSSVDRELQARARGPAGRLDGGLPPGDAERGDGSGGALGEGPGPPGEPGLLAQSGSFVRVVSDGQVIRQVGDVPEKGFPAPGGAGFATVRFDGRRWRTLTVTVAPSPQSSESLRDLRIQFAVDAEPLEDRITAMRARVAVISGAGIVLAGVLAALLSGLALRPLSRLRSAVAGVSTTRDLSLRLPEGSAPREVDELAHSVNGMLGRLELSAEETERALQATRRFAADAGHELRTPLTSIRANFDSLRRNPGMPPAEREAILSELSAEQNRLVTLLDALQALARGDAGAALPRLDLDLADIVDAAVESAGRRHPAASFALAAPDDGLPLEGWPDGLRLLVDNLLENAVRHGGRAVRVTLQRRGAGALLAVDDDGPGIPVAEREQVFERFIRGSTATVPGSGLGLALAAQQAALHGGGIEVGESDLGGARLVVRLSGGRALWPAAQPG